MKHNIAVFDIETAPLPEDQLEEPRFEARGNLKDPDKIAADLDEKRAKWLDTLALSPLTGRVLAWGYLTSDGGGGAEMEHGENEKQLITNLFKEVSLRAEYWWVGHNIFGFDIPFLVKRAWKHGIEVPSFMLTGGYGPQRSNFIDTMWWWTRPEKPNGGCGLNTVAKYLGVGEKNGSGKDFAKTYYEDKKSALEYLANDLKLTMAVAKRMQVFGENPAIRKD